jgi:two-component system, OmpR family, sensor kinase
VSLRSRLVFGLVAVVVVLVSAMYFVVTRQRDYLINQVDDRLRAASPLVRNSDRPPPAEAPRPPADPSPFRPVSDIYLGVFDDDGTLQAVTPALLVKNEPAVTEASLAGRTTPFTAPSSAGGDERFRVLATKLSTDDWLVVAVPLSETDAAVARLLLTLLVAAALVMLSLGLTVWWIVRLGLRPIAQMTETAAAISAGARDRRAPFDNTTTEVGRLGRAFNDMLDQRDVAEARLRQFVADASHELRTPLTSIRGYLDLTLDGAFEDDQRDDVLRRMRRESKRMNDLVEDLLLLASLDEGRPLHSEPVDVSRVARDAVTDGQALHPDRVVGIEMSPGLDPVVQGDEMRLAQVVAGLVRNALTHTPPSTTVRVMVQGNPDHVVIHVVDNGPGMDDELAGQVFDRFSRGDPSRSRHAGGAGLGLAIAKSIVHAHGGSLTLVTAVGKGCTFSVRLPRRPQRTPQPA